MLPASIVIAALLIGGSMVWSAGKKAELVGIDSYEEEDPSLLAENVFPVSEDDRVWGSPDAPVKIVTFTDFECPFCKDFHDTLKEAKLAYGNDVVIVYRHFPLDFHEYAQKEAEASECVAELAGDEAFWKYADKIFAVTESTGTGLSLSDREKFAVEVGADKVKWNECVDSGKYAEKISGHVQNGIESGAQGTPFTIVIGKEGMKYVVSGAYPFEAEVPGQPSLKAAIESALLE